MIQLRLFGTVSIHGPEGNDLKSALVQSKRTALLAYLAIARPRTSHRRENLLAMFWPELSDERARRALNQAIYYLRSKLGSDSIVVTGEEIGLSREHIACDVIEFEALIDAHQEEKALSCYQGPLLSGFYLSDMLEFERWLDSERARLHDRAARAAWVLADHAADAGSAHDAIQWARRSLELSRDEAALRHLIAMRDRFGDRAGAIREYDKFARQLTREIEADPSPETQELIAQIRARSGMSSTPPVGIPSLTRPRIASPPKAAAAVTEPAPPSEKKIEEPAAAPATAAAQERREERKRIGFLLVSLVLVIASAWVVTRELESRRAVIVPGSVAILPFSYTGSIDHADAAEAVVNLLDANIQNTGGVHTVDWRSLKSFVDRSLEGKPLTLAAAGAAAKRFNAEWYIVGSVAEAGDRLRVNAAVYDRNSGDSAGVRATVEGDPNQLFAMVDELTAKVIAARTTGPNARLYRSAVLTTNSIPALKAYLEGERDFREARYISALQKFRQAVEADSTFALAYFRLSQSAELTGESPLAMYAATRALDQSRGLGRYERQHAEAWRFTLLGRVADAEKLYRGLIAQDTTDIEALQQLAYLHYTWGPRNGHPSSESGREWRHVLNLDPYNSLGLVYLARITARESNRTDFTWIAKRVDHFGPESDRALELNALKAFVFDDSSVRPATMRDLATASPTVRERVLVSVLTSAADLKQPASLAAQYLRPPTIAESGADYDAWLLPSIAVARGRIREALELTGAPGMDPELAMVGRGVIAYVHPHALSPAEMLQVRDRLLDPALALRKGRLLQGMPDYVAGLLDIRLGDMTAAARQVIALDARSSNNPDVARLATLIRAEIARSAGNPARALVLLGTPRMDGLRFTPGFTFPVAHERFLRAELLRELGRTGEALRWYATFPDPAGYDLWFLGIATTHLADSYGVLRNPSAAKEYYLRVARLWSEADPVLQPVRGRIVQQVKTIKQ
ncbi:MAG: BTAD domain-containing putative transcriptional regulator [Gemmatimonadales bacterium]